MMMMMLSASGKPPREGYARLAFSALYRQAQSHTARVKVTDASCSMKLCMLQLTLVPFDAGETGKQLDARDVRYSLLHLKHISGIRRSHIIFMPIIRYLVLRCVRAKLRDLSIKKPNKDGQDIRGKMIAISFRPPVPSHLLQQALIGSLCTAANSGERNLNPNKG